MSNKPVCLIRVNTAAGVAATCIEADRFTVGRLGADFIIPDKGVSRIHLTVTVRGNGLWLEDMGSANGTYVGGQKLPPGSPVSYKPGTSVQLGVSRDMVTFEIVDRAMTQKAASEAKDELERHPSRSLGVAAPTADIAKQADEFLREARAAANQIKEIAGREAESMMNSARQKASELISKTHVEIDALMERARNNASQATLDREAAAEHALAGARRESQDIRNAADEEAERIHRDARSQAAQVKAQAQREAEELLRNARMGAANLKDQADVEVREILKDAREKNRAAIEKNEQDMERALSEARAAAIKSRDEADELLERARTYMQDKGAQVMREAEEQAARIREEAMAEANRSREEALADAGRVREEARADGLKTIESGLREAEAEIVRVKAEAQAEIDQLHEARARIDFEITEVEKRKSELISKTEEHLRDHEMAERAARETREILEDLHGQVERARADMTLAQTMREGALQERDEALGAMRQIERDIERLKLSSADAKASLASELKEIREKGLLEFENRKKAEDAEMANMKLRWLEEMKARQVEEERQARILKTHQVVEMTRHLEMLLVPKIQRLLGEKESTLILGEIKQDLEPMVKRVVLEEQLPTGGSEIEGVISSDPMIEKFKRKEKFRARAMFAAPALLFVAAVALPEYFEVLRSPGDLLRGGKSLEQIVAERRARDLASQKKFNPPLTDELGRTYSDSVLYTRNYAALKKDPVNFKRWSLELEKFMFNELGLPETVATSYVSLEMTMIDNLIIQRAAINPAYEKEGIARLRKVEDDFLSELKGKVGGDIAYDRIRLYEKKFFETLRKKASSGE